jgi:hypothetical protein
MARKNNVPKKDKLQNALVLFHYMLAYFGCTDFKVLSESIKDPAMGGVDENGISRFYRILKDHFFYNNEEKTEQTLEYDHHIVKFTNEINARRKEKIQWKYYQYLTLLFTEIYLDRYFRDRHQFVEDLNNYLHDTFIKTDGVWNGVPDFTEENLNKLAFWCATGSGKTLLMHIHIKQFLYYAEKYGRRKDVNNIILLTPNEELSRQHMDELRRSNIGVELFSKDNPDGIFGKQNVQIIEITKLGDENGDKTVAVDSFEDHNLVLIDEAHKGSSGETWMGYRNKLTQDGFSFEYSATFGQAIGALGKKDREELLRVYGQSTLFDYSYRYFYNDGYGKDYRIMNMREWNEQGMLFEYLAAYLLCLYEQKIAFNEDRRIQNEFLISNPLAVFVGGSVSVSNTKNAWGVSDVVLIVLFLKNFIENKSTYSRHICDIINGTTSLTDNNGNAIFENSFKKLRQDAGFKTFTQEDSDKLYDGILKEVFHTIGSGSFHIDVLKGTDGEIGLRIGDNPYFGLLYVGDTKKVRDMCAENDLLATERDFGAKSLFADITKEDSPVNILIGSKKFSEGWSCWRVSIMGLMNFGKSEGSMIIQMFGRGVRLKGYKMSLKRSSCLDESIKPATFPKDIKVLETLNIFGIRADYMDQFKAYLEDEGLSADDSDFIELKVKTKRQCPQNLKIIRLDENYDFKREEIVHLEDYKEKVDVKLDWYPRIDLTESPKIQRVTNVKDEEKLSGDHLKYLDWEEIFFAVEQYKNERGWYNLELDADELRQLMEDPRWYTLKIPQESLRFKSFAKDIAAWQELTIALLDLFVSKAYIQCKKQQESSHQIVEYLKADDPNFIKEYDIEVNKNHKDWVTRIESINNALENGSFLYDVIVEGDGRNGVDALQFDKMLFNPVFFMAGQFAKNMDKQRNGDNWISIIPASLNDGERNFIESMKTYFVNQNMTDKEVYLLRNSSRKGLGFFETEGFYPDFLLWIWVGTMQYLTFIDPKGIRNLSGIKDEKVQLFKRLNEDIAPRLNDSNLKLNSFIISDTPFSQVPFNDIGKEEFKNNHVLFQEDKDYVKTMVEMIEGQI